MSPGFPALVQVVPKVLKTEEESFVVKACWGGPTVRALLYSTLLYYTILNCRILS